jgi:hypothetical protein
MACLLYAKRTLFMPSAHCSCIILGIPGPIPQRAGRLTEACGAQQHHACVLLEVQASANAQFQYV